MSMEQQQKTSISEEGVDLSPESFEEIDSLKKTLEDRLEKEKAENGSKARIELFWKIMNFATRLQKDFPDADKYALFHVLTFSAVPKEVYPNKIDFEGENSIKKFIESL